MKYFEKHLSDAQLKTTSLDSCSKLKYFCLFAAESGERRVERGRETRLRRRREEIRDRRSEAAMSRWKEKRRREQWRDLSEDSCVLVYQVAKSIRPQNLLRTRGKPRREGEIEELVFHTFVHFF